MADLLFKCSECSKHLAVDAVAVGAVVNCTECGRSVIVPEPAVAFECPECQAELVAPDGLAGEAFDCPNCETVWVVPESPAPSPTVEPAPNEPAPFEPPPAPPSGGSGQAPHEHHEAAAPGRRCPGCGRAFAHDVIICYACEIDLRTGKPVPKKSRPATATDSRSRSP